MLKLSDKVKYVRKNLGITQSAFGEGLGVSKDIVCNIETGRSVPNMVFLQHLCSVYHINPQWFFGENSGSWNFSFDAKRNVESARSILKCLDKYHLKYAIEQLRTLKELSDKHNK